MPDVRVNIVADDQASAAFRNVASTLGNLRRELEGLKVDAIKRFGEYAGNIHFERSSAEAQGLRIQIEALTRSMNMMFQQMERIYNAARPIKIAEPNEINVTATALNRIGRELDDVRAKAERMAYGVTTALKTSFASASELEAASRRISRMPVQPSTGQPQRLSVQSESELSIMQAMSQYEIQAAANSEALAQAKKQQATAVEQASRATASETQAMQQSLATEYEMNQAANAAAQVDAERTTTRRMLAEQTTILTKAEEGYANAQRYSAEQQKAAQEIQRLRQSQQTFAQRVQGFFGIDRTAAAESAASIEKAAAAFEQAGGAAGRASGAVRSAGHSMSTAGEQATGAAYMFRKFITELDEMARGQRGQLLSTLGSQIRDIGVRASEAAGGGVQGLIAGLTKLGPTIALSGAVYGAIHIKAMTQEMEKLAQANFEAANAAGMSLIAYEQLANLMDVASGKTEVFARAMEQVDQLMERARQDPMSRERSALGQIFGGDTEKFMNLRDSASQIDMLRDAWQRMGDTAQRTTLFMQLLGRSGLAALTPALSMTQERADELNRELMKTGAILSTEQNAKLREAAEASGILAKAFEGLKDQVALGFADNKLSQDLTNLVELMTDGVIKVRSLMGEFRELVTMPTSSGEGGIIGWVKDQLNWFDTLDERMKKAAQEPYDEKKRAEQEQQEADRVRKEPGSPRGGEYGPPMSAAPQERLFSAEDTNKRLEADTKVLDNAVRLRKAQDDLDRARVSGNAAAIAAIDKQEEQFIQDQLAREMKLVQAAIDAANLAHDSDAAKVYQQKQIQLQEQLLESQAHAIERQKRLKEEEYQDYAAKEREKIQESQGDWAKILQIYQEWADHAKQLFGEVSKQFQEVQKDMVKAAQDGIKQITQEELKYADSQVKVLNDQVRINELSREAANVNAGSQSHQQAIAGYQQELAEAQAAAAQEMALYDQVAHEQGITSEQKLAALEKEEEVGMQAAEHEIELAKKIAEEQKKAAEEATKAWTDFFKKEGDDLTSYLENVLERKPNALRDFIDSTRKNLMKLGENLLSESLGKAMGIDVKAGSGLGGLFEGIFDKIFGISSKDPSKETANAIKIGNETAKTSQGLLAQIRDILKQQHAEAQAAKDKLQTIVTNGGATATGMGKVAEGQNLSLAEMKGLAEKAGFSPDDASTIAAIAMAESKGDPYAKGSAGEVGLTQILPGTTGAHAMAQSAMGDPLQAFVLAKQVQESEGWKAWSTYKDDSYKKYLSAAQGVQPAEYSPQMAEDQATGQAQQALAYALTKSGDKLKDYCATLVNESLEKAGVKGSGSGLASSFAPGSGYGTPISADQVRAGDIFYKGPSGAGDTGHVGFTMGPVKADTVQVMSSHISGDPSNPAGVETRSTSGMSFVRPPYSDNQSVNISQVGGANIASPNDPGALPTSATQQAGLAQVQITQSIPIDVNVKSMPQASGATKGGVDTAISSAGGFIPYPTSMPSDVKAAIRAHGLGGMGRRAYGPGVNDNQGGMLAVVHPGEMIVPADVISQMPSSQGGAYDQFGGESRGFQSVAMVQAHPGIGKGLTTLLMILGGVGAIAGISALFGGKKSTSDQQQTQDMLKDPNLSVLTDQAAISGAGGGQTDLSPLMASKSGSPTSSTSSTSPSNTVQGLTTSLGDVTKSLSSMNTAATGSTSALSPFSAGLNEAKSGLSMFTSALSAVKGIGGLFGGGGGGLLSIFGLNSGGVIPSAAAGMIVPRFQGGGILSMLHMNEMVLPSHISQFVQNAAANGNASASPTHVANFNINAIDAKSGAQFLMNNSDTIARAYARSHRAYSTNIPRS